MANKQTKITRLTEGILSKPQLITPESYATIASYLYNRNQGLLMSPDDFKPDDDSGDDINDDPAFDTQTGVGVIEITGSLSARPVMTLCGAVGTSYQAILEQTEEMLAAGVKTIVMHVNSGGGEAFSCFSAVDEFRSMVDDAGATVYGYADGMAASAAYAWLVCCDEVYAHPDSEEGSIGVVCALMDDSKYMDELGLKRIYVHAGDSKVPYAPDGSIRQEYIDDLQYKIDALYENFVGHVAKYSGLSDDAIKSTQAKTYLSNDALKLGLIDGVMTTPEFQNYVSSKINGSKNA